MFMQLIEDYGLSLTTVQNDVLYEIYRRSKIVKVIENVKNGKYRNAIVFTKYIAGDEFKPYNLDGEHYFIVSVATYGEKFDIVFMNGKNVEVFITTKNEGNEIYKKVFETKRFKY